MGKIRKQLNVEKIADKLKKEMLKTHLGGMSFVDNDGVKFEVKYLSVTSMRKFFNKTDIKRIMKHRKESYEKLLKKKKK